MQYYVKFDCRECGSENAVRSDTSGAGVGDSVKYAEPIELRCSCGHVSGVLRASYEYRREHLPSWERAGAL